MTTDDDAPHAEPRTLVPADAAAVTAVVEAAEVADTGLSLIEVEDIAADWRRPGFDLAEHARGWERDGVLVACAELFGGRMENYVHPDHRGRGLGTEILAWTIDLARRTGVPAVGQTLPVGDEPGHALLAAHGFEPGYESWVLALPEGREVPRVALPAGYRLRGFVPGADERAAHEVIERAFSEWPGRRSVTLEEWVETTVRRSDFEPWQLRLVEDADGTVVAACLTSLPEGTGWVDQLAVAREHRGRGLAQVLLADAFATTRARGATRAELNTDSRTGALGLYLRVGMEVVREYRHRRLELAVTEE